MRFMNHAAWTLVATYALAILYELYRATLKAGTSRHDSIRVFAVQGGPFYLIAGIVVALLFTGRPWAVWVGLAFTVVMILVSIFFYNPRIMVERKPGLFDWFEDLVYTGLLFVAAAQLIYAAFG
jgi:hypothetical protein